MTDLELTRALAGELLGWRAGKNRFLKPDRSWTPLSSFVPTANIKDSFTLLEAANLACTIRFRGQSLVEVELQGHSGIVKASGVKKAPTICQALALALNLTESNPRKQLL